MKILSFILISSCFSYAITVEEIIKKMEETERYPRATSVIKQTITTSSGKQRTFTIKGYSLNGTEKQLQIYQAPARVSGEKILMLNDGDDIWTYSPRTSRVRHLATHMKKARVMGSDFAYEDFGGGDYLKKFTIKLLGEEKMEGVACHKLEMIPTSEGPSYTKEIVWVGKTDFIPRRVDYYDDEGLLKILSISEVKMVQDRATPMEYVMENKREGGQTAITVVEMDYQAEVNENMFTERGLKK